MANVKITALTNLGSADVDAADVFVIDDVSATETKKITVANLQAAVDTIATSNINTVSANADAYYVQLNANINVVQDNVATLSTILRVAGDSGADDVTVGTDDLTFTGDSNVSTAVTDNTVTISVDFAATQTNIDAVETRRADNTFFTYNSTGDQANVIINAANVEPSQNNVFSLGAPDLVWKDVYVGPGTLHLGPLRLHSNDDGTGLLIRDANDAQVTIDTGVANVTANLNLLQDNISAIDTQVSANLDITNDNVATLTTTVDNFGTSSNSNATALAAGIVSSEVRLNANLDLTNDNVSTLSTTVDNFGTSSNSNAVSLASGIVASEVRVNANLDVTNDNVANIVDGTTPFSAPVTFTDNVTISGSLIVTGAQVDLGVQSATVDNNFIELSAELGSGDTPATDSGLLINRGNKGNVFIGDHLGEDGVIFVRTQTPDTNTTIAIESFMDLHANAVHVASPVNLNRVHVGLRASEDTGIIFDDSGANINFVAGGSYVANVHYDGTLNSQNAIIAPAIFAGGVELQANDSATLFSARANDFATYTHITANIDIVQDNVSTLTTTVDNHGTFSNTTFDTKANVSATFIQLNANVDVVQDNVAAVESRRAANIAGAVSTITTGNLTASRALASDGSGKVAVSAVTSTELGYLDGVTSAIQTQIDSKSSTANSASLAAGIATNAGDISTNESTRSSNAAALAAGIATKLASSDYTASDVLTKIKTVDGSGSGLDADLLDGQSSAYYAVEATRSANAAALAAGIAGITPIGTSDISNGAVTVDKLAATLDLGAL